MNYFRTLDQKQSHLNIDIQNYKNYSDIAPIVKVGTRIVLYLAMWIAALCCFPACWRLVLHSILNFGFLGCINCPKFCATCFISGPWNAYKQLVVAQIVSDRYCWESMDNFPRSICICLAKATSSLCYGEWPPQLHDYKST